LLTAQEVLPGSYFSMIETGAASVAPIPATVGETTTFTVQNPLPSWVTTAPDLPAGTVVAVQEDGTVSPVDMFVPAITTIQVDGLNNVTATVATTHHFAATQSIVFRNMSAATFLNNQVATVTSVTPNSFTVTYAQAAYGPAADTGNAFPAIDASGALDVPNPDGVTTAASVAGGLVPVSTTYGGGVQIPGLVFSVGEPVYAGLGGVLTQDYTTLITQVGWVAYVGRGTPGSLVSPATDTIIYEPHIPTLYVQ